MSSTECLLWKNWRHSQKTLTLKPYFSKIAHVCLETILKRDRGYFTRSAASFFNISLTEHLWTLRRVFICLRNQMIIVLVGLNNDNCQSAIRKIVTALRIQVKPQLRLKKNRYTRLKVLYKNVVLIELAKLTKKKLVMWYFLSKVTT